MDDYKKQEEKEAKEAIRKLASVKIQPYINKAAKKAERKVKNKLSDLKLDEDKLKITAGTLGTLDAINKGEVEGGFDVDENTRVEGKISPREKAIRLLFNQRF